MSRITTGPSENTNKNPGPGEGHGGAWGRPSTRQSHRISCLLRLICFSRRHSNRHSRRSPCLLRPSCSATRQQQVNYRWISTANTTRLRLTSKNRRHQPSKHWETSGRRARKCSPGSMTRVPFLPISQAHRRMQQLPLIPPWANGPNVWRT